MRSHIIIAAVCVLVFPGAGIAQDVSLEDGVKQLQQWEAQIVSLRVRHQVRAEADTSKSLRMSNVTSTLMETDWAWDDSGRALESRVAYNNGVRLTSETRISDGKKFYTFANPSDNPGSEFPARVSINSLHPGIFAIRELSFPLSILYGPEGDWLSKRARGAKDVQLTDSGLLQMDGLSFGYEGFNVTLDPAHGYLPQSVEYKDNSHGGFLHRVDEYREVQPGFWFPWKGVALMNGEERQEWQVTQVDLNTDLPASLFTPKMGPESYVIDNMTGKEYWHSGKPPARLIEMAKAPKLSDPSSNGSPLIATPSRSIDWTKWLVLLGFVFLSGGVWLRRRS